MDVAGLTLSAVALATLFNACVECFETFSQGRNLERDFSYLLIRLDFERTQLLLWGNSSGILNIENENRHARLADPTVSKLVEDALGAIKTLLSDASLLQQRYGVRSNTAMSARKQSTIANLLSTNSMNVFRTSWSRFCTRAAQALPDRSALSTALKARWAIHDRSKFTELLDMLSTLVEKLYIVIPVPDSQHHLLENDLAAILDIQKLSLVEAALKHSSPRGIALSKAASVIISNSEIGTIDRRNIVEWLRDTQWIEEPDEPGSSSTSTQTGGRLSLRRKLGYLSVNTKKSLYFVNTPECRNIATPRTCPSILSAEGLPTPFNDRFHSIRFESFRPLFPKLARSENFQPDGCAELFESLQQSPYEVQELVARRVNQILPFGIIYIHTSPCQCAIQTALCIANALNDDHLKAAVRVDDRISSSCFHDIADRIVALQSIFDHLNTMEPSPVSSWRFLDQTWLGQRLYTLESDLIPGDSSTMHSTTDIFSDENYPKPFAGLIIIGEVDFCAQLLQAEPFPWTSRFPRACEVYEIAYLGMEYRRKYVGRFAARPPITNPNPTLPVRQAPEAPDLETERPTSRPGKRPASPLTPGAGKRPVTPLVTSGDGSAVAGYSSD